MELVYAVTPEIVPAKQRHQSVVFPNGKVDLARLETEVRSASGISVALATAWVAGNDCTLAFKGDLPQDMVGIVDAIVATHSGEPLSTAPAPLTSDRRPRIAVEKTDQARTTIVTHDWSDPTTWYPSAVRVVREEATTSDNSVYALAHRNVIDTFHGKLFGEDFFKDAAGNSYRVRVAIGGLMPGEGEVGLGEVDPHIGTGDFTVDYAAGTISFTTPVNPNSVVYVTYHYATVSDFLVAPKPGTQLSVDLAEVQFSSDVVMSDSVVFQVLGYADVFAPQLLKANGGPLDPGTRIPLGNPVVYKAITDFQADAVRSYPAYPPLGGGGWRGQAQPIIVFDWDYISSTVLHADRGMQILMKLQHDVPFGGWYATATLYCIVKQDDN